MPEDVARLVGCRVRRLRESRGLSQELAAHLAGLHRTYWGGLERGERNASLRTLSKIAEALEVDIRDLFPMRENEERP